MLGYVGTMIIIQTRERIEYLDKRHREATRKQLETPGGRSWRTRLQPPTHAVFTLPECYPASHSGQRDSIQGSGQHPIIPNHKEFQEQIKTQLSGPDVAQGQRCCTMKLMGCQVLKPSCLDLGLARRPGWRPAYGQKGAAAKVRPVGEL